MVFIISLSHSNTYAIETQDEKIRKNLFKDLNQPQCHQIAITPSGNISIIHEVDQFVFKIVGAIREKKIEELISLFHPKLKISRENLNEIFARIENTYGNKLQFSAYRLWALNTVDGSPLTIKCADPSISINALYGYNLQFSLWLQIMGLELGRIYIPIVFSGQNWYLGGLHVQQWTHDGKNYIDWAKKAENTAINGDKVGAYFQYDLAQKLGFGDRFFKLEDLEKITTYAHKNFMESDFEKHIKSSLKDFPIEYASPLFVKGGAGLLVRIRIQKEISLIEIKSRCQKIKDLVKVQSWSRTLTGIRCSFVLPRENPSEEGSVGGILLNF